MAEMVEKAIHIPWMIDNQNPEKLLLLVSAPDGTVFDVPLHYKAAEDIETILSDNNLWRTFFQSLIRSIPLA